MLAKACRFVIDVLAAESCRYPVDVIIAEQKSSVNQGQVGLKVDNAVVAYLDVALSLALKL